MILSIWSTCPSHSAEINVSLFFSKKVEVYDLNVPPPPEKKDVDHKLQVWMVPGFTLRSAWFHLWSTLFYDLHGFTLWSTFFFKTFLSAGRIFAKFVPWMVSPYDLHAFWMVAPHDLHTPQKTCRKIGFSKNKVTPYDLHPFSWFHLVIYMFSYFSDFVFFSSFIFVFFCLFFFLIALLLLFPFFPSLPLLWLGSKRRNIKKERKEEKQKRKTGKTWKKRK